MGRIGRIYRRLWSLVMRRPTNFSWVIPNQLAGSGRPMAERDLHWWRRQGVEAVITLTEYPIPEEWVKSSGVRYLHNPLQDHNAPSVEEIDRALDFILKQMDDGKPVVVHCAAGQGRTGSVLAGYFIKQQGLSAEDAIRKIRQIRPRSIEGQQEQSLYRYEEYLNNGKRSKKKNNE
ncbi:MAG: dual specificity protein phosphatase family protein [Thaumarchaeota archaeon]|nr:dual specificity protein phosphatase family protein [Nitrososphaerota archaeon]